MNDDTHFSGEPALIPVEDNATGEGQDTSPEQEVSLADLIVQALDIHTQCMHMMSTVIGVRYTFEGIKLAMEAQRTFAIGEIQMAKGQAIHGEEAGINTIGERKKSRVSTYGQIMAGWVAEFGSAAVAEVQAKHTEAVKSVHDALDEYRRWLGLPERV